MIHVIVGILEWLFDRATSDNKATMEPKRESAQHTARVLLLIGGCMAVAIIAALALNLS